MMHKDTYTLRPYQEELVNTVLQDLSEFELSKDKLLWKILY